MTWPLAFVLVAAMLVIFAGIREWRRIQVADAEVRKAQAYTTAALSTNMRAASDRMERHLERIERMRGAQTFTPPETSNVIPGPFGKKKPGDDGDVA